MSDEFRELLLGCGHSRVKKMQSVDGNPNWRGLVTLDNNEACDPDVWFNLDSKLWREAIWRREPNQGGWYSFVPDMFDEVHAYEVLEHLGDQGDARSFFAHFTEIWRILKSDGYLYAMCPSRFSGWLWGDPSHRRAILPESLTFLDQAEYIRQLDGPQQTAMSDFRSMYRADFKIIHSQDNSGSHMFVLQAVKPSRWKSGV